ncbi:fibronectin-binding SSURE repeat-containing protein [Streptococcus sp. IsoGale021]|uniref:SSURE domain-containing protein n=1 Tax=Streptococcus TaxID=1301 RepID=UPI0020017D92|nr:MULTISPECIES: fibronectin-binding SSURE repeat-containing protein [Streptococcus]MCY7209827.1 fibronectin-binding SSURE repeat-containing protein [Streptococcus anginosus]MCY7211420.1 fibronectin-binding SSURE repeat-containing protein [Streptococcus anginosus]MDQ8693894.1 fibronectin-binding SSURE repeat-containing protein [Streptococcus sp. IsoGale021]MDU5128330.1 fibronectin-binding SSURE repeat-containing protein [Streptococcus anginosus]MEE0847655.1 fibronectin-binding SSURE repeat-con
MVDKNHRPDNQRYTRWSIRRLSVGVASVVVASGFFILISNPVNAQVGTQNKVVTTTPSNSPTESGKSILDSKVGQTESSSAEKKETPSTTKTSQDLSGKTTQTPDKKVQEKQEVTKESKVGKTIAEAAKEIQKATETVVKEATPKGQEDPSLAQAKQSVSDNIKGSTDVPASFLQNANHPGPFTAGVNEVIPYELFGGDGMLTRLLLKSSNGAPWSDNGTAKHAGLLPFANIPKGKYFYQVSLNGKAAGKQGKALLDQLKANGTHSYTATVTVYGATKDGKADLNNVVATRQVNLNLNGQKAQEDPSLAQAKQSIADNIKGSTDVPASFLANANHPGPFTAGVNEVIPYELFGGDGMLTRLLLKSSDGAPWSDNGTANHAGLLPFANIPKGKYFYQVSLNGKAAGKQGKALLNQLKANGTHSYTATVTVYGATKDGKADLNNVIATRQVNLNLNGTTTADQVKKSVADNIKDKIDVPASYLTNAVYPGPFTAGVNQVIPYELFGGDGMLTRLLLKSSNGAPWSDNGKANHAGLLPLAGLGKGQYFYQVSLDGNVAGKQDKALLEQLKANGTHSYKATVTVYGATKDGKADLNNVIATKSVTINLKGEKKADSNGQSQQGQNGQAQNQGKKADHDGSKHSNKGGTPSATTSKGGQARASKKSLPNTGQKSSLGLTVLGLLGLSAAAILALVGMKRREKK